MDKSSPLRGRSVLVVEDEPLIALDLQAIISAAGASVLAARSIGRALQLIGDAHITAAILDFKLGSVDCTPLCLALNKREIPFMFYTGYGEAHALVQWTGTPIANKPASPARIVDMLCDLIVGRLSRYSVVSPNADEWHE